MPNSSSINAWNLRMAAGSLQQWLFTFTTTAPGGITPYPISGASGWEFVARPSATDLTVPPLIDITTASTAEGQIIVTSTFTLSQIQLNILPAATASLDGTYYLSLWMSPGTTSQFCWVTGLLIVEGTPQP